MKNKKKTVSSVITISVEANHIHKVRALNKGVGLLEYLSELLESEAGRNPKDHK